MEFVPRTVMIGGKVSMCIMYNGNVIFCCFIVRIVFLFWQAAPGYYMAKLIIKLFNSIAKGGNIFTKMELFIPLSVRYQRNNACLSFDTRYFHFVCVRLLFF